jgi:dTDP-4-amino-4,6-dideoxygalactose transaminase
MIPLVNLSRLHAEMKADLDAAIAGVFADNAFIGGPHVRRFEDAFSELLGPHASGRPLRTVGVSSGTSALSLVLEALGIGPGDEVIVPAHTFAATAESVRHVGATPVFADIEPRAYTLAASEVARLLTPRTRAVVPVHIYGGSADLDAIAAVLPADGSVALVEDAAQAHLGAWRGRSLGAVGVAGTFSFYPGKNLGAVGDAGAVTCADPGLAERIAKLRDHGRMSKYEHDAVGYNHRMDGLQGAVLAAKLPRLRGWTDRRRALARAYDAALKPRGFKTIEPLPGSDCVYHLYVVEVSNREETLAALARAGVQAGVHYPVPLHRQPAFERWADGPLPATEAAAARIVSLPLCAHMTDAERETVAAAFLAAAKP